MKRALFIVLATLLAMSCFLTTANASPSKTKYSDISGHWAQDVIERWSDRGIVTGSGGRFRPNDSITRGELSAILNRLLLFPSTSVNPFHDLTQDKWYYSDMLALANERIIPVYIRRNYFGWTIMPEHIGDNQYLGSGGDRVSREGAAVMIAIAFGLKGGGSINFTDYSSIGGWAKPYVIAMVSKGFMGGFPDGSFKPGTPLTRAQVLTILDNMIDVIIDKPGTYGSDSVSLGKNILINCGGVKLLSQALDNLFLSPGAVNGNITLENCKVADIYAYVDDSDSLLSYRSAGDSGNEVSNVHIEYLRGYKELRFDGGDGTESAPFVISTEEQLLLLNEFELHPSKSHYVLSGNIQLTSDWKPVRKHIYSDSYHFYGVLDGGGHTISGFNIDYSDGKEIENGHRSLGLFANLSGTVENLTVQGTIIVEDLATIHGTIFAGGICGELAGGSIRNCISLVDITIKNGTSSYVGGIAGFSPSVANAIESCSSSGSIYAHTERSDAETVVAYAGGIVGRSHGKVFNSSSSGDITASGGYYSCAGGIVGSNYNNSALVHKSYSTGTVTATNALMQNNAGGIAGHAQGKSVIQSCFSIANVTVAGNPGFFNAAGGIAGALYEDSSALYTYATGNVTATSDGWFCALGGIVGRFQGSVYSSYSTSTVRSVSNGVVSDNYGIVGFGEGRVTSCADLTNTAGGLYYDKKEISKKDALNQNTYDIWGFKGRGNENVRETWMMSQTGYPLPMLVDVNEALQRSQVLPPHLR